MKTYRDLHLFCGLGGGALGFQGARAAGFGLEGRFQTLAGIDNDPAACADFERLTGAPATCADLATMTPEELLVATGGVAPDVVFTSPPCKGFSGLLGTKRLLEEKYQALNRLVFQGLFLVMETWPENPPKLIVLENVPRIATRGADLLRKVRELLSAYGYATSSSFHDCGELGGLGQHRKRFLLVARHTAQVPTFMYQPPLQRVRAIGEVLGALPLPDDAKGGAMHRLPRLEWRTWVRLALIPAGQDWRALGRKDDGPWSGRGTYGIARWEEPSPTVTANGRPGGSGATAVADVRLPGGGYNNKFRIVRFDEPSVAVTGGGTPTSGGVCVADPRPAVGPGARDNLWQVQRWDGPATTVTGAPSPSTGALSIADPRLALASSYPGLMGVIPWTEPAPTVSGQAGVTQSNMPAAVADPRFPGAPAGARGPAGMPADGDRPEEPPVILALDGTWHRPVTTFELAALQDLPVLDDDGAALVLEGKSHSAWRERIGNAVPRGAATAIATQVLLALLSAAAGATFALGGTSVWVQDDQALAL